eukprot:5031569-Amphidinium_carterae.2
MSPICGQVELNVHTALPFHLWDWLPPLNSSVINRGVKGVVLKGAVVWSLGVALRKKPAPLCHSTLSQRLTGFLSKHGNPNSVECEVGLCAVCKRRPVVLDTSPCVPRDSGLDWASPVSGRKEVAHDDAGFPSSLLTVLLSKELWHSCVSGAPPNMLHIATDVVTKI